jgi:hypothetical protein
MHGGLDVKFEIWALVKSDRRRFRLLEKFCENKALQAMILLIGPWSSPFIWAALRQGRK